MSLLPKQFPAVVIFTKKNGETRVLEAHGVVDKKEDYVTWKTPYEKSDYTTTRFKSIDRCIPMEDLLCVPSLPSNRLNSDGNVEFKVGDKVIYQNLVSPQKGMVKTAKKVVRVDEERKLLFVENIKSPIKFENARLKSSAVKHLPKTSAEGVAFKEGDKIIYKNLLNPDKGYVKSAKKIVRVDEERKLLYVDKVKSPIKFENAKLKLPGSNSKTETMDVSASNPFTGSPLVKQNLASRFEEGEKEEKHQKICFADD
mmetsp:Transcript_1874/g.2299  ORF Transcript_1874/g.2299 Transcript_1874/m.2299 type:complete len:256 (+) Transcript_1874:46-813(+)